MPVKNETATRFMDEFRIISPWAYFIALLGFLAVVLVTVLTNTSDMVLALGIFAGTGLACYIVLIGYINKDAGRRSMSRVLWTLLAIFVPNGLGVVLYFILRKPRIANCPQCGAVVEPGFGFCPRCRHRLAPVCPQCQRSVNAGDKFCPYCSVDLGTGENQAAPDGGKGNQ